MDADEAARVLRTAEDSNRWQGIRIGQGWRRKTGPVHVGCYVSDLVEAGDERRVVLINVVGRRIGAVPLWKFLADYELA